MDYLFGYSVGAGGSTLEPLPLNPLSPRNTYTLPASRPRAMVLRYSRRDREILKLMRPDQIVGCFKIKANFPQVSASNGVISSVTDWVGGVLPGDNLRSRYLTRTRIAIGGT